jgi:GH18 family chitinase
MVSIAIGGWNNGDDSDFEVIAADSAKTVMFIDSVMAFVHKYKLDGVDMDWEYPESGQSASNYVSMMSLLAQKLNNQGKILTAAVVAKEWDKNSIKDSVFTLVDWLNLMAYDNYDAQNHSSYSYAEKSLDYWTKTRSLPKEKAVLGLPFYGLHPYTAYKSIVSKNSDAPYADNQGSIYYNGLNTIHEKTVMAMDKGAGVMCWELSQDVSNEETSLLNAMYTTVLGTYTSVEEEDSIVRATPRNLKAYPNPVADMLYISASDSSEVSIKLYNTFSYLVSETILSVENGVVQFPVTAFKPGIYILKVESENQDYAVKIAIKP